MRAPPVRGSLPSVNPLTKVRSGATTATAKVRGGAGATWRKSRDGTTRTAAWVKDGVTGTARKTRWRISSLTDRAGGAGSDAPASDAPDAVTASAEAGGEGERGIWERIGAARLLERARSNSRVAITWTVAGFLVLAWIAWAVYVTAENGANAGLGVVISWPAVFAALALVAAPFVGATLLVRRLHHGQTTPLLAGGVDFAAETADGESARSDDPKDEGAAESAADDDEMTEDAGESSGEDDDSEDEDEGSVGDDDSEDEESEKEDPVSEEPGDEDDDSDESGEDDDSGESA